MSFEYYKWKKRPMLVHYSPGSKDWKNFSLDTKKYKDCLVERKIVIIPVESDRVDFHLTLFGLDGEIKYVTDYYDNRTMDEILFFIDQMPMRKKEIKKKLGKY